MAAADDDEIGLEFFGLLLDGHDGAAFYEDDGGFDLIVPADGLELLGGFVEELLAVMLVVYVDGGMRVAGGVEEREASAEGFGDGSGGFG